MAVAAVKPLVMKDVNFLTTLNDGVSATDYKKHLDAVTFTPTSTAITWTGLGANTHTNTSQATWTCTLNYVQDWETSDSLSVLLYEHEGETMDVEFRPVAGGPGFTASVLIQPGAIGGTVNTYATTSVTLGVDGKPELSL